MKEYKISIISGIYFPPEQFFRKFLDSCLSQTLEGIEFIYILDHPDDKLSRDILEEYKDKFEQSKNDFYIYDNNANIGVRRTQIKGFEYSHGKYIAVIDDDDYLDSDYFENLYNFIVEKDKDIVAGLAINNYTEHDIEFNFMSAVIDRSNHSDFLYLIKRPLVEKALIVPNPDEEELTEIVVCFYNATNTEQILTTPLYKASFYHYIRHGVNTSKIDFHKNIHYNEYAVRCAKECKIFLKKALQYTDIPYSDNKEEMLKNMHACLGTDIQENDFDYDRIKRL